MKCSCVHQLEIINLADSVCCKDSVNSKKNMFCSLAAAKTTIEIFDDTARNGQLSCLEFINWVPTLWYARATQFIKGERQEFLHQRTKGSIKGVIQGLMQLSYIMSCYICKYSSGANQ